MMNLKDQFKQLTYKLNESIYNLSLSSKYSIYSYLMSGINKNTIILNQPLYHNGYVFFGKPKLNLSSPSIKNDRILSVLNTMSPDSLGFAIRCYLDPIFVYSNSSVFKNSQISPLIRNDVPYIPLLSNMIESLTGWSDPTLETETTEGGFFSENITFAKGSEDFTKTINLSAKFKDIEGSPVLMLFMMWYRWIMLSTKGVVIPYNKYIEEYKISYSCSIYRFRLDTSGTYITFWSRGIGCFPTSYPIVDKAEFNKEETIKNFNEVTIPITVNFPSHLDPITLVEFNIWIRRWCPQIENWKKLTGDDKYYFQHIAVPYINFDKGKKELEWRVDPSLDLTSPDQELKNTIEELKKIIS